MFEKITVQRLTPTAKLPTRGHDNDAGLDLYADESLTLPPGATALIRTGLKMAIPDGYVGLVWDKSGLAKAGLHTMAGVIDSGYRGEIILNIVNHASTYYTVELGQKIAQILIQPVSLCSVAEAIINDETSRGENKHGSTGLF